MKDAETPPTFHEEPTAETPAAATSAPPATPEIYNAPTVEAPAAERASPEPALKEQQSTPAAPPVSARPPRQRQGLPLSLAIVTGIVILALLLGGSALYFHWLPGASQTASTSKSTSQSSSQQQTPAATATTHASASPTAQAHAPAPQPLVPAGKLLYSTALPACDAQKNLWKTNSYAQLNCGRDATTVLDSGGHIGGVFLHHLPGGEAIPNDYVLQVQVQVQENASAQGPVGIFFRTQPGANHQGSFAFLIQPSGYWQGNIYDDTTGQSTTLFQLQGTALNTGGFSTLDIVVQGNIFSLYIDGTRQGGIESANYPSGIIGLVTDQGASALFKNLAIYALPGS